MLPVLDIFSLAVRGGSHLGGRRVAPGWKTEGMISLSYFTRGSIDSISGLPQKQGDNLFANDRHETKRLQRFEP